MDPLDVIAIDRPAQADPWPRILRLLALVALLFAVSQVLVDWLIVYGLFRYKSVYSSLPRRWEIANTIHSGLAVIDALTACVMIAGALLLLKKTPRVSPLLLAAYNWLFIWTLDTVVQMVGLGFRQVEYLGHSATWIVFPLLAILLLKEYAQTSRLAEAQR